MSAAIEVFISYSHKDEELCERLRSHLALLQRLGHITDWHDRKISAGTEWAGAIDDHLRSAKIILLLISADFLASDYCYDVETKLALARHDKGEAIVIPVILRPVDWTGAPFAKLQALPKDGKPVTLWPSHDEAFALVSRGIRQAIERLANPDAAGQPEPPSPAAVIEGERVLDAAIAQKVFVGRTTELLVQVRRTEAGGLRALITEEPEIGIDPEQVRSKPFDLTWPVGPDGKPEDLRLNVNVDSPQFAPARQTKCILVPPDDDSEVCSFLMTPQQTGPLLVQVELEWNAASGPQRTLRTRCEAEGVEAARPAMNVVSIPAFAAATAGWSSGTSFGYAMSTAATPAAAPAAAAPIPVDFGTTVVDEAPAPVATAPPPEPLRRSTGWGKGAVIAAMLVVAIGIGITQVGLMTSGGNNPAPPTAAGPKPVWLAANRTPSGLIELRARWNPAWGGADAEHGYRITGIPEQAEYFETVRCPKDIEYRFELRPPHPERLTAIEVCPLVLNDKTHSWERNAAPCRTLPLK